MKVFASWSGGDSREAAELMKDWLPNVLQEVEIWVSSQDITKGDKWSSSLWASLTEHQFGLLFVTKTNLSSPWILFEAGALSKSVQSSVIPVLCNVDRIDISTSPLNQFQNARVEKEEIFLIVEALNRVCDRQLQSERLRSTFEKWWPDFETAYSQINFLEKIENKPAGAKGDAQRLDKIENALESIMGSIQLIRKDTRRMAPSALSRFEDIFKGRSANAVVIDGIRYLREPPLARYKRTEPLSPTRIGRAHV